MNIIDTCRLQPGSVFLGGYFLTPANRLNEKEDGRKEPLIIRSLTRPSVALVVVFTVWLTIGQMLPMKKYYVFFIEDDQRVCQYILGDQKASTYFWTEREKGVTALHARFNRFKNMLKENGRVHKSHVQLLTDSVC